jgi:wyosine [tRNA(Phe)-imidazoG37] synthetase (radical SAM superfamily)
VISELIDFLEFNQSPDYITFSGSGEPTLNSEIGQVIQFIKQNYPKIPVAIISNGTLFYDKQVRSELLPADLVIPSLDAVSVTAFRKINRPERSLNIRKYIYGLAKFRKEYKGKYWLEIFIIPGFNDNEKELKLFKRAVNLIQPDKVQINSLDRPGPISTIRSASGDELEQIVGFFQMENAEIISSAHIQRSTVVYRQDIENIILETIARRPCTLVDLSKILGVHPKEINKYLKVLKSDNKISSVEQERGSFYQIQK